MALAALRTVPFPDVQWQLVHAERIKELFAQIAEKSRFTIDIAEVDLDHVHVLVDAPPTLSCTDIATRLKSQSTYHIWRSEFRPFLMRHFWDEWFTRIGL